MKLELKTKEKVAIGSLIGVAVVGLGYAIYRKFAQPSVPASPRSEEKPRDEYEYQSQQVPFSNQSESQRIQLHRVEEDEDNYQCPLDLEQFRKYVRLLQKSLDPCVDEIEMIAQRLKSESQGRLHPEDMRLLILQNRNHPTLCEQLPSIPRAFAPPPPECLCCARAEPEGFFTKKYSKHCRN